MKTKFENIGRIMPISKRLTRKRRRHAIEVKVSFWLADFDPPYASGKHLFYETEDAEYRIYNPLGFRFCVNQLMSYLRGWHALNEGQEIIGYEVIKE